MPSRKRKSRRSVPLAPDPVPVQEEVSAPEPLPVEPIPPSAAPVLRPALLRADHTVADGLIVSRRPGDHWRNRLQLVWRPAGECPTCTRPRVLLVTLGGEAAVCDLFDDVAFLATQGACTCAYAALETSDALT